MASKRLLLALGLITLCLSARAQQWAVQTNLVDYANFGTLNIEGGVALSQHWSATAVAKLNPFHYKKNGEPLNARQQVLGAGVRWWPWHVYSGWWAGTRVQFQEYNRGGIKSQLTDEGDRLVLLYDQSTPQRGRRNRILGRLGPVHHVFLPRVRTCQGQGRTRLHPSQ